MSQEPIDLDTDNFENGSKVLSYEDFQALARIGHDLTKDVSLELLLQNILQAAAQLTDSRDTSIMLSNGRKPSLYFAAATGDKAEWLLSTYGIESEKQIPLKGSKAGLVFTTGKSLVENVVSNHYSSVDIEMDKVTESMICVILRVGSLRLGVMQVLNKSSGDYTDRDRIILEYFADQASIAIRNAQLLQNLLAHSGLYGSIHTTNELFARMEELNQDARTETLSVLFADMRGFTQLCQSLINPVLVQERLSEFISMLSQVTIDHDGIVNKFLGDGVMALFQGEQSSIRAVKCAFSMVNKFSLMKDSWNQMSNQQLDFLDIGVGITTDEVILGGIGSYDTRDYTAIGTAVNLAAAFEHSARNGVHILCDQLTFRNANAIISKYSAPQDFLLQKPGQEAGVRYKCYQLESLKDNQQGCIFISHSHADKDYIENLIARLKDNNINTWYSTDDIPKGALWTAELRKAISKCNWMIVIVSKNSAGSMWVSREVDLALAYDHLEDRIIPITIDDTPLTDVNVHLSTMQAVISNKNDDIASIIANRISI